MRCLINLHPLTLLFLIVLSLAQCKKGDTGLTGPAGPAGSTGSPGPPGTSAKGDSGTANVIYSAWLDVKFKPDSLKVEGVIDTIGYYADIAVSKLDSAIISGGEMKVYMNVGIASNPDVFILPYSDPYSGIHVTPEFFLQRIHLYSNANVGTVTKAEGKYLQYRYILIRGVVNGRNAYPVDWRDYARVKALFDLKD